jgi:hypothetical protein
VPFTVGIAWSGWAVWAASHSPIPANGFPFGPASGSWKLALLFALGSLSALGGPLLGLAVGRWLPQRRGAAGRRAADRRHDRDAALFEPLRRIRVVMPWTSFGGPFGVKGDSNRALIFTGSPQWYLIYLLCLFGLAVTAALGHHPAASSPRWKLAAGLLLGAAVATGLLAMWTGTGHTIVNPLHS